MGVDGATSDGAARIIRTTADTSTIKTLGSDISAFNDDVATICITISADAYKMYSLIEKYGCKVFSLVFVLPEVFFDEDKVR